MSKTPSDCTDHGKPHLFYVTDETIGEPITLTVVEKEGGERHRWQPSLGQWLLLLGELAPRLAKRWKS